MNIFEQPTIMVGLYAMNDNTTLREIKQFFNRLTNVSDNAKNHVIGDFNSDIGNKDKAIVGRCEEDNNKNEVK